DKETQAVEGIKNLSETSLLVPSVQEMVNQNLLKKYIISLLLINHGVSSSLVEKVKLEIQGFFNIQMSENKKFWAESTWTDLKKKDTLELYSQELQNLTMVVIEQMEKALKIEETEMREFFEDGMQSMRMNYYPPCPQPEKVIGLTPLFRWKCSHYPPIIEGLQIRKDGIWIPIKPLHNAFILNIGDMLE
ncbi:Protein SRG1, partial [Mucuna pruriens]